MGIGIQNIKYEGITPKTVRFFGVSEFSHSQEVSTKDKALSRSSGLYVAGHLPKD
jgi:hypothetical protein